jgi:cytoskeleton protein RodZ
MDSFGARLRHERERRRIALRSIAERTKIGVGLLEGLERDDVSRWPSGIFRKSFIRAYAGAIGLDPDVVLREFVEQYPDPTDVAPAVAQVPVPAPVASGFAVTVRWSGSPFGGVLADLRKRWFGWHLPAVPVWFRSTDGSGYEKEAIAAIMKVDR